MSKFDKVKSSAKEVQQKEAIKSNVAVSSINLMLKDLVLDPNNNEDTEHTEDLEYSIGRFGFRGAIEVTPFGCPDGKYMVISGHRRFKALERLGYNSVACLVYDFQKEEDIIDYNQCMNNATRDSAKDPLLWFKRYKTNRKTLLNQNPNMSETELDSEISKRFGLSVQQIGRLKALTNVIPTAIELAMDGKIGLYSLVPLAPLKEEQQNDLYNIFMDALEEFEKSESGETLTRQLVTNIVRAYNKGNGIKTWDEYKNSTSTQGGAGVTEEFMNTPTTEETEQATAEGNNEDNGNEEENTQSETAEDDLSDGDGGDSGNGEAKERKNARQIVGLIKKLDTALQDNFTFDTDEDSVVAIQTMGKLIEEMLNEMNNVALECTEGGWDAFMLAKKSVLDTISSIEA